MKAIIGLAVLLFAAPVFADDDKGPGGPRGPGGPEGGSPFMRRPAGPFSEGYLDKLKTRLDLDSGQEKKIKAVLDASKPEHDKLHEEQKELLKKIAAHRRQTLESIREVLTLEQKEKFDGMRMGPPAGGGGMGPRMGQGPGMGGSGPRGEKREGPGGEGRRGPGGGGEPPEREGGDD